MSTEVQVPQPIVLHPEVLGYVPTIAWAFYGVVAVLIVVRALTARRW